MIRSAWLGRMGYGEALAVQEQMVAAKIADRSVGDALLLLEHESVYTIGRTLDQRSLGGGKLPFPVVVTGRGGQATYHGPGQLIGYPVIDLKEHGEDLHRYLRKLEGLIMAICGHWGVVGERQQQAADHPVGGHQHQRVGAGSHHLRAADPALHRLGAASHHLRAADPGSHHLRAAGRPVWWAGGALCRLQAVDRQTVADFEPIGK